MGKNFKNYGTVFNHHVPRDFEIRSYNTRNGSYLTKKYFLSY